MTALILLSTPLKFTFSIRLHRPKSTPNDLTAYCRALSSSPLYLRPYIDVVYNREKHCPINDGGPDISRGRGREYIFCFHNGGYSPPKQQRQVEVIVLQLAGCVAAGYPAISADIRPIYCLYSTYQLTYRRQNATILSNVLLRCYTSSSTRCNSLPPSSVVT